MNGQNHRIKVGRKGEDLAAEFLKSNGYTILGRNYRAVRGEIDIVAQEDEVLIFIEVKSGYSKDFGDPENWVTERKQQQIGKVALAYLQQHDVHDMDCRFDVIAVTFEKGKPHIKHIKDAFWL